MKRNHVTSWYLYQVIDPDTGASVSFQKEQGPAPESGLCAFPGADGVSRPMRREILACGLSEQTAERVRSRLEQILQRAASEGER